MKRSAHLLDRLADDLFALIDPDHPADALLGQPPGVTAGIETMASFLSCVAEDLKNATSESDAAALARLVETARGVLYPVCDPETLRAWHARTARYGELAALERAPSATKAATDRGPRVYCQNDEEI